MKQIVKVFPDWQSTGLWCNSRNVEPYVVGITNPLLLIALKYWHSNWEWTMDYYGCTDLPMDWCKQWIKDGERIVGGLNDITAFPEVFEFKVEIGKHIIGEEMYEILYPTLKE